MAIALVVLFHAGVPFIAGGYVGVDVFFVISGYVITGVLLRQRSNFGRASIADFYMRRFRRILPASTLVILVTVVMAYVALGPVGGSSTADAGRWAAAFLANVHYARVGTDYFASLAPPSPLLNYWSLAVEEQFYLVYPSLFFLAVRSRGRRVARGGTLGVGLVAIAVASFALSVLQTSTSPTTAYFSPFTRAWELAIGGLVALATTRLRDLDIRLAALLSWIGCGAVLVSAVSYGTGTPYPGAFVALPVLGTAAVIAGGTPVPPAGAERILRLAPFQWLGARSYSLYLWHWPLLVIAAERVGKTSLNIGWNLVLVAVALVLSMATYRFVEQPVRRWRSSKRATFLAAASAVIVTLVVLTCAIELGATRAGGSETGILAAAPSERVLLSEVAAASHIHTLPTNLEPPLTDAATDTVLKDPRFNPLCTAYVAESNQPVCTAGDRTGAKLMVVYGDSHATMWFPALDPIARAAGWRLVVLSKLYCPASLVTVTNPRGWGQPGLPYQLCGAWHQWVLRWLAHAKPDLLVITQRDGAFYRRPTTADIRTPAFTTAQWQAGLTDLLRRAARSARRVTVLGDTPLLGQSPPVCLSIHASSVQACSTPASRALSPYLRSEQVAAARSNAGYVSTTPWFCSATCTPIVKQFVVGWDNAHVTASYARHLSNVLRQALGLTQA